jgi:histidinol-phosphate aminotransferase
LIFLCSPNNPSGNSLAAPDVRELLEKFKGIVVVDEAYADFAPGKSLLSELANYNNLVIMQTFSKAWGLANLRLGMAFADPQLIEWMSRIKYPYNVNGLTQEIGYYGFAARYDKRPNGPRRAADRTGTAHQITTGNYRRPKKYILPTQIFYWLKFHDARRVFDHLISQQIIVRDRSQMVHCANCLRITVGTAAENDILIAKLKEFKS